MALRSSFQKPGAPHVNEGVKSAPPEGSEEARAAAIEPSELPVCRPEELRGADLRGQDLTDVEGSYPSTSRVPI